MTTENSSFTKGKQPGINSDLIQNFPARFSRDSKELAVSTVNATEGTRLPQTLFSRGGYLSFCLYPGPAAPVLCSCLSGYVHGQLLAINQERAVGPLTGALLLPADC